MCVDWERLNELKDDIGEEDFADVATLFVSELQDTLSGMQVATAAAEDFHFLRGSAANLGFTALVAACSRAEAAAKAGEAPDVAAVKSAFNAALAEMSAKMPDLAMAA
ncbi:Hpt domain-containing protein [Gymnodinialimonas hymeniacidonis]|uniref:Hpt domain-containing protein n=1 Tax=Gymnodinialimonas hymeniacidonis TaxID=3126508 RepID=UPI0034C5F8B9